MERGANGTAARKGTGVRLAAIKPTAPVELRPFASIGLWPWVELGRRNGIPIERLAEVSGVRVAELRDPDARLAQGEANRIAELICQQHGPDAGIAAALTVEAGHFTLFELLARTAPTLNDALVEGCRYFSLVHGDARLVYDSPPTGPRIMRLVLPDTYAIHRGFIELTFAVWMVGIRRETAQPFLTPAEVWFRHPAPQETGLYEELLGPGLRFGMPEDHIAFDRATTQAPLSRRNSELHAAAVDAARELIKR
jgi:hypothetical protein